MPQTLQEWLKSQILMNHNACGWIQIRALLIGIPWFQNHRRTNASLIVRDMGISSLVADKGIRNFVKRVKEKVFPGASEEAKEPFLRLGQQRGDILA